MGTASAMLPGSKQTFKWLFLVASLPLPLGRSPCTQPLGWAPRGTCLSGIDAQPFLGTTGCPHGDTGARGCPLEELGWFLGAEEAAALCSRPPRGLCRAPRPPCASALADVPHVPSSAGRQRWRRPNHLETSFTKFYVPQKRLHGQKATRGSKVFVTEAGGDVGGDRDGDLLSPSCRGDIFP